jgi:hypothetical protein
MLKGDKIRSTTSFGWEVKRDAKRRNILRHVKEPLTSQILICKTLTPSSIPPTNSQMSLLVELSESSGGRVRSFPQPASLSPWHSMLKYHPRNEQ